ncbi:GEL complex subunit OPTI-like [Artemia franciscana]|uniref:GEL complex subunit OPTI-like n=1 Tax=Artemia franciscana TaxID=6661 RepID=UPI0032D9B96E
MNSGSEPDSASVYSSFVKAFSSKSDWPDKEEFLDVIYWIRQIVGIVIGIIWGVFALQGFVAIASFGVVNSAVVYFYSNSFQQIDEEEYGGMWELLKEGFMTSFAGFLVTWIIFYSGLHHS